VWTANIWNETRIGVARDRQTDRLHAFGLQKEFRKLKYIIANKYGIYRTLKV